MKQAAKFSFFFFAEDLLRNQFEFIVFAFDVRPHVCTQTFFAVEHVNSCFKACFWSLLSPYGHRTDLLFFSASCLLFQSSQPDYGLIVFASFVIFFRYSIGAVN